MQWTWVWVDSRSWWWTVRPSALQFIGSQKVGHHWATELNWTELMYSSSCQHSYMYLSIETQRYEHYNVKNPWHNFKYMKFIKLFSFSFKFCSFQPEYLRLISSKCSNKSSVLAWEEMTVLLLVNIWVPLPFISLCTEFWLSVCLFVLDILCLSFTVLVPEYSKII